MFGLNLIFFIFVAIAILAGNRLGYTVASIAVCLAAAMLYVVLVAYWIPLLPTSPSYEKTSRKQHKWYQAPVLWIAVFATLLVWWWQSLGLE